MRIGPELEGYGDGYGRGKHFYRDTWVLVSKQKDWGFLKISEGDHLRDLNIWVGNGASVWVEGECQINWGIGGILFPLTKHWSRVQGLMGVFWGRI